jgi:hypothetical protein
MDGNLRSESIPAGGSRPEMALSISYPANPRRITFTKSPHANFIFPTLDPFAHPDHLNAA